MQTGKNEGYARLIDEAIRNQADLFLKYQDYNGTISQRIITPLEWAEPGKLKAMCHMRGEERTFKLSSMVGLTLASEADEADLIAAPSPTPIESETLPPPRALPTATVTSIERVVKTPVPPAPAAAVFSQLLEAHQWRRLLGYYRDCLVHEYQQQFSFDLSELSLLNIDHNLARDFILGKTDLVVAASESLKQFLDPLRRKGQQLCVGVPLFVLNSGRISPLFYVPLTVEWPNPSSARLKPEEFSLSYAALSNLRFSADEIVVFLEEFQQFRIDHPQIDLIEAHVLEKLSERLTRPLPVIPAGSIDLSAVPEYSVYDGAGLFWANSQFTGSLIEELGELSLESVWPQVPDGLRVLFNHQQYYEHTRAPDFIEDTRFYVTNINDQQRRAARSAAEHPLTVITGPPGTGKSQLVLNLIAQAYLDGKTVLFASHNNKAVDVVMDRLQGEIGFQGAVRSGSAANRKRATEQMSSAVTQIRDSHIADFKERYRLGKRQLKTADELLERIKDLKGRQVSFESEKTGLLEKLPERLREKGSGMQIQYEESEKQRLQTLLSGFAQDLRILIDKKQQVMDQVTGALSDAEGKDPAIQVFKSFEDTWGRFARGLLHPESFESLETMQDFLNTWLVILPALQLKRSLDQTRKTIQDARQKVEDLAAVLTEEQKQSALELAGSLSEKQLNTAGLGLLRFKTEFERLIAHPPGFFQKLLISLGFTNPRAQAVANLSKVLSTNHLDQFLPGLLQATLPEQARMCSHLAVMLRSSLVYQFLKKSQAALDVQKKDYEALIGGLPSAIVADFDRLDLVHFDAAILQSALDRALQSCNGLLQQRKQIVNKCRQQVALNAGQFQVVAGIKTLFSEENALLFEISDAAPEKIGLDWAHTWQHLAALWEINDVLQHIRQELASLPREQDARESFQQSSQALLTTASDLMRETWYYRASQSDNETFTRANNYISAVSQLNELNYGENYTLYRALKDAERDNFEFALRIFPVWAITTLTARTNFPLKAGLFDLLIVDEASQCDIPSVLPLLYRAKKVVVIGDPNQLRHVASLDAHIEHQVAAKQGVGLEAYSYTTTSLYDLAQHSAGLHPGPILLDEHYRSDPRIINFSNQEFYAGQLKIKTDLTKRGYEKDFINSCGGVRWVNVKGQFIRPVNGSAYNPAELEQIQRLTSALLSQLDSIGKPHATLGIVTPFRAHENRLRMWLSSAYPGSERVQSGTAHQFQGDECDFMIFSPVLSAGMPEGTLRWLDETYNLLNVAITRARVGLIVVGDWDYCIYSLPATSRYHRLAKYIQGSAGGVVETLADLSILGATRTDIVGTLLDPSSPEHNRITLERFIASCKEYVWWMDGYFDQNLINLMDDLFDRPKKPDIKELRLLTAERQIKPFHGHPPELRPESIEAMQRFLRGQGVMCEVRTLPGESLPHDRFLYHPDGAINMPPFAGAYGRHRHISEYTASKTSRDVFLGYWDKAVPAANK